jgi:hypothetical protein
MGTRRLKPYSLQPEEYGALDKTVQEYLALGALAPLPSGQRFWESPIFGRVKKGGLKVRLVTDLKHLNEHVHNLPFKMEGMGTARETINPGDWMAKVDISNAFFHVPVDPSHQNYLVIEWKGELLKFQALPFGLNVSPRVFTKVFRIPMKLLRKWGMRLVHYIDDILVVARTREEAQTHLFLLLSLLVALGFVIAWPKVEGPTQETDFLGFLLNSSSFTIKVPPIKLEKIQQRVREILASKTPIPAKDLAEIVGKLGSLMEAIPVAHLYTRNLNVLINEARRHGGWERGRIALNPHARKDLEWWLRPDLITYQPIRHAPPRWDLTTDACEAGWGGFIVHIPSHRQFGPNMHRMWGWGDRHVKSINPLELQAGLEALELLSPALQGATVRWNSDNTAVVHTVAHWKSQSLDMNSRLRTLHDQCARQRVHLITQHLPGVENTHADLLSRWIDPSDYKLHPKLFAKVAGLFEEPSLDAFASASNTLLPRFWSFFKERGTEGVDAFKQDWWRERLLWINPPFALIPAVLKKIREEEARALLCTPLWEGRPWWPSLMAMAVRPPLLLPTGRSTFLPGTTRNQCGIGPTPFTCVVTQVSGQPEEVRAARKTWGPNMSTVDDTLARRMARRPVRDLITREAPVWGGDARLPVSATLPPVSAEAPW